MSLKQISANLANIPQEVGRTVIGYEDVVTDLLTGLLAQGHVLLEGAPGVAKTTLGKTFAHVSGLMFRRVQSTQDLLPADITGYYFFNQKTDEFEIRRGPVFTNVLLADEINRAPPKTQSALLEAMEERQITIEGRTFYLERPFMVIATMNPVDMEGVYRLPEAQLDRFMIRTQMTYLPDEVERAILERKVRPQDIRPPLPKPDIIFEAQEAVKKVHVESDVIAYVQAIASATRKHPNVTLGASPRSMEQMLQASRALALIRERDYVTPDDVKHIAPRVLNHRLILDTDAEIEGQTTYQVIDEVLQNVEAPKGLDRR